jgi:hypothetical protein
MKESDEYCHYSGLPSPMAYANDYDETVKKKKKMSLKKIIQKISLWFSLIKKKPKRKSVWDL